MKTIIANFKSNKNSQEAQEWVDVFSTEFPIDSPHTLVLCPPAVHLPIFQTLTTNPSIKLGLQDISPFPAGAYTGAIGTKNVEDLSVEYVIVGHSERRQYFHETSQDVANKIREALQAQIRPIVCVTKNEIHAQAAAIENEYRNKVIVAFEPVEHIGTGVSDTLPDILTAFAEIKDAFGSVHSIYGGSVSSHTPKEILTHQEIDGFLIGTATLDPHSFIHLVQTIM